MSPLLLLTPACFFAALPPCPQTTDRSLVWSTERLLRKRRYNDWLSLKNRILSQMSSVLAALLPSPQTTDRSLVWNTDLIETMELENLLINAAITMHSAERRKVGCYLV
jgi:succinate dehydrogenase/fumarate reductase flavoprotein subunit